MATTKSPKVSIRPRRLVLVEPDCQFCGHRALLHGLTEDEVREHPMRPRARRPCRWPESYPGPAGNKLPRGEGFPQLLLTRCPCRLWHPGLSGRWVTEAWVEDSVNAQWTAAYRLVRQDGQPVIAELRVFPTEPRRQVRRNRGPEPEPFTHGEWAGRDLGIDAPVPASGLTHRLLRQVSVRAYRRALWQTVKNFQEIDRQENDGEEWAPKFYRQFDPEGPWPPETRRRAASEDVPTEEERASTSRGRPRKPALDYAKLAAEYVRELERGSLRPVAVIARRHRWKYSRARDMLNRARVRGLLTRVGRGRAEGRLTEEARKVLRRAKAPEAMRSGRRDAALPRPGTALR